MAKKGFIDDDNPLDKLGVEQIDAHVDIEPGALIELEPGEDFERVITERVVTSTNELADAMAEFAKQLEVTSAALLNLAELIKDLPPNETDT